LSSIFANAAAEASFKAHVRQAAPFVRFGVRSAVVLRRVFGPRASRIPLVRVACGPLEALVAMHNRAGQAPPSGHRARHESTAECEVDDATLKEVWDLCVVGSGPGGSVTAAHAVERGERVLIMEAGGIVDDSTGHHTVAQMMADFAYGGQEIVLGPSPVPYAQGRAWGGGSEINSGLYHHIPTSVAAKWAKASGLSVEQLHAAAMDVERRLPIQTQPAASLGCYVDSPIEAIRLALDWRGGVVPRWREYGANGFTHYGMAATYLRASVDGSAQRTLGHRVDAIALEHDSVALHLVGEKCSHTVRARQVALAAGVIGTPEILKRSRLARTHEFAFKFHAMIREVAEFDRVVNDLDDIDPHQAWTEDNRFKVGAAVSTPALLAATMAQKGLEYPPNPENFAAIYISFASNGRNGLISAGTHLYPYFLPSAAMKRTAAEAGRTLRAGIKAAEGRVTGAPKDSYSTVHVFGSLPLGETRVVDATGAVRGTAGRVIVRDASILPSHPLVNPQGPLMHLVTALEARRLGGTS
jgi:hypothetical protein